MPHVLRSSRVSLVTAGHVRSAAAAAKREAIHVSRRKADLIGALFAHRGKTGAVDDLLAKSEAALEQLAAAAGLPVALPKLPKVFSAKAAEGPKGEPGRLPRIFVRKGGH